MKLYIHLCAIITNVGVCALLPTQKLLDCCTSAHSFCGLQFSVTVAVNVPCVHHQHIVSFGLIVIGKLYSMDSEFSSMFWCSVSLTDNASTCFFFPFLFLRHGNSKLYLKCTCRFRYRRAERSGALPMNRQVKNQTCMSNLQLYACVCTYASSDHLPIDDLP